VTTCLDPNDTKAVFGVLVGDALDQAGQDFPIGWDRLCLHVASARAIALWWIGPREKPGGAEGHLLLHRQPHARRRLLGNQVVLDLAPDPLQPFFGNSGAFAVVGDDGFELLDAVLNSAQLVAKLVGEPNGAFTSLVRELVSLLQHCD
jgi:hypothetical protein